MKRPRSAAHKYRTINIPVPNAVTNEVLLVSRLGSKRAADRALQEVIGELGLVPSAPRRALAAVALARLGGDLDLAAKSLDWRDFEDFCAMVLAAAGYRVRRNVRLRKPTRQIDIVAESASIVLAIDCKNWRRGVGAASLEPAASAQAERAKMLMERSKTAQGRAYLPVLLTVLDNRVRVLDGVPVVPLHRLKEFLSRVSPFEESFRFFTS